LQIILGLYHFETAANTLLKFFLGGVVNGFCEIQVFLLDIKSEDIRL